MLEHRRLPLLLFCTLTFLNACVSTAKRIVTLENALGDSSALAKLCDDNRPAACALLGKDGKPLHILPIMQSVTSEAQTRLVIVAPVNAGLSYFVVGAAGPKKIVAESILHKGSDRQVDHVEVFELRVGESYELVVIDGNGQLWDRRKFQTLDRKKKRARIILTSCMDDKLDDVQKKIWPEALAHNVDAIVMVGDTVYTDWKDGQRKPVLDPLQIWQRYAETREHLELFKANPLVPVIAVWDDHDYGKNDGDRTFPFKEEARGTFHAFYDQRKDGPGFDAGPGVASWWSAFGVQIALLDGRTFRSPNGVDLPDQTHFGVDQESWLKEGLAAATGPVLVSNGDQFFGGYHTFESYEGNHPKNFKAQLARWRRSTAQPIVFMSGDRHLTEIIKVPKEHLGYATYEITSSAIHAIVFPEAFAKAPSPLQLAGRAGEYNYTVIEIVEAASKKVELDVKSFGLDKKLIYQQTLTVKR